MTALSYLIPVALGLGLLGLAAFLWALRAGQFEDLDGAAFRVLEDDDKPLTSRSDQPLPESRKGSSKSSEAD